MTKVWINVQAIMQESREELLVATCDSDLLGKKIVDGKFIFDINKKFYGGELVDIEKMINALRRATIANIVGEECINAAVSAGIIDEINIKKVKNIPHAQLFQL